VASRTFGTTCPSANLPIPLPAQASFGALRGVQLQSGSSLSLAYAVGKQGGDDRNTCLTSVLGSGALGATAGLWYGGHKLVLV